ncbi:hypothetical protein [Arsenicibacter rosenii]|uniref:hypothetical protein n=1 Tax=Arsenicibacter rosenii TaxID=1750698 RepID=UPI001160C121|nr:hypothetical protein [Arsenicibacter rosenii]
MPRPSQSPLPANEPAATRFFSVTGLAPADEMPVYFEGKRYDLARLTDEEAEYLLQFPEQVPYLTRNP